MIPEFSDIGDTSHRALRRPTVSPRHFLRTDMLTQQRSCQHPPAGASSLFGTTLRSARMPLPTWQYFEDFLFDWASIRGPMPTAARRVGWLTVVEGECYLAEVRPGSTGRRTATLPASATRKPGQVVSRGSRGLYQEKGNMPPLPNKAGRKGSAAERG